MLGRTDVVVLDIETTGWLPPEAAVTEIGAVRLRGGRPVGQFEALVNPGRPIPAEVAALTGITDALVAGAPPICVVLPEFLAFAGDSVLAAHNAPFDIGFLSAAALSCGARWPPFAVLDTAVLARLVFGETAAGETAAGETAFGQAGGPSDCKLATLADFFGAATAPRHRALADALAAADVLTGLLALLTAAGPGPATQQLRRYAAAQRRRRRPAAGEEAAVVTAIVLIKADVARIPETAETIVQIPQVSEVYSVTGEFDLVAMVRVRTHDELGDVIPGTLNKVAGVTHTETHIAFRTYSRHDLESAFAIGYGDPA